MASAILTSNPSTTSGREGYDMDYLNHFAISLDLLENEENLFKYRKGGFHPTCIGDEFRDGRYRIRLKLGWGGYSTVWLARDVKEKKWVSLKILIADTSKGLKELDNRLRISQIIKDKPGPWPLCKTLDHFSHHGPNGTHHCFVQELVGPTLKTVLDYKNYSMLKDREYFDSQTVLKLSSQLLQAVAKLHSVGISHGELHEMSEDQLIDVIGDFDTEPVRFTNSSNPPGQAMPRELTESAPWSGFGDEDYADIGLIDFGESFNQTIDACHLAQPPHHKAPESIFERRVGLKADLWRAGMIIYSLVFSQELFYTMQGDVGLVAQMLDFVQEDLPPRWRQRWLSLQKEAGIEGKAGDPRNRPDLKRDFHNILPDPRLGCLYPVIKGLTRLLPADRISAGQALSLLRGPH